MEMGDWRPQSDFGKKWFAEGEVKGWSESVVIVLRARGLVVSDAQRERILACRDIPTLDRRLRRAVTAAAVDEALE